jgi:hypothetical protein
MDAHQRGFQWNPNTYSLSDLRCQRWPTRMRIRICLVCTAALAFACFPGRVFAQVPDIWSGPRDVLYIQSEFDRTADLYSTSSGPAVGTLHGDELVFAHENSNKQPENSSEVSVRARSHDEASLENKHFRWRPALGESLLFTGVMHAFNITTEAGTRDTLDGHWFQDYMHSVSELRGWSDSDTFMAPYVGHPLEGSIFGFIERQNDPKYRLVQWGDGREYWISMLRSMAYSAVWHTQWKIGPASEASIGNVMLHASPGFICLVDTPTLGFVVMLAEDAADRYAIMGLENRTTNRPLIILARSFLNPGRTFANIMCGSAIPASTCSAKITKSASRCSLITRRAKAISHSPTLKTPGSQPA